MKRAALRRAVRRLLHHPRRLPVLALAALVAWLVALVAAPATLAPGSVVGLDGLENRIDHWARWTGLPPLHAATYAVGDLLCHQKDWRSFHVNGNQLPIDERMSAIFAAAAPGMALGLAAPVSPYVSRALDALLPERLRSADAKRAARKWTLLVALALLPAALDVAWENLLGRESTALARVVTGTLAGIAGGLVLTAFLTAVDAVFGARLRRPRRAAS